MKGQVNHITQDVSASIMKRVKAKAVKQANGCLTIPKLQMMHNGRYYSVRRAIVAHKGVSIPPNRFIFPKCGNRKCVNPAHMALAKADEAFLRDQEGKPMRSNHASNMLTAKQVREIRNSDKTPTALSAEYGHPIAKISDIRARRAYRWVKD